MTKKFPSVKFLTPLKRSLKRTCPSSNSNLNALSSLRAWSRRIMRAASATLALPSKIVPRRVQTSSKQEHASGAAASSNKASTPSDESLETTMTNEQLILFINSNIDQKVDGKVDQKVEEKLQPIKSKIEQNGRAFVGEVITLLLWVMGLGFGASIVALIASSLSNPSASHVLSTVSHPARAAFGLVAPIMPLVGTNCTHHAVQLNDWMQYKQVELATLRSSIEDTVNTSDANNKVFVAKQRAHDVEFQERIRAAEEATYNCIKTNNALTSEIEILKQDFDAIRRQHDVWRNQEINFLSTHMGAVVIPGKTQSNGQTGHISPQPLRLQLARPAPRLPFDRRPHALAGSGRVLVRCRP